MYEEMEVIEPIINYHKIKYDKLIELIRNSDMEGSKVNVFINLNSILNKFYREDIMSGILSLKYRENIVLTAEIINLVAHYRHFFWSRFKVPSKFYFYYCNKVPKYGKKNLDGYMSLFKERINEDNAKFGELTSIINNNLKLVNSLSTYVQGAYFITSDGLEQGTIPYYIIKKYAKDDICNLILTSDKLDYQLANLKNTFILKANGKNSKLISKKEIFDYKYKTVKYRPKKKIHPSFYPLVLSFCGCKSRELTATKGHGFVSTMKLLDKLISSDKLENKAPKTLEYSAIEDNLDRDLFEIINTRYKTLSYKYQYLLLNDIQKMNIENKLKDKYDNIAIMGINVEYFPNNNIQLVELCEGVEMWQ